MYLDLGEDTLLVVFKIVYLRYKCCKNDMLPVLSAGVLPSSQCSYLPAVSARLWEVDIHTLDIYISLFCEYQITTAGFLSIRTSTDLKRTSGKSPDKDGQKCIYLKNR